jgi:hypothetical protein
MCFFLKVPLLFDLSSYNFVYKFYKRNFASKEYQITTVWNGMLTALADIWRLQNEQKVRSKIAKL